MKKGDRSQCVQEQCAYAECAIKDEEEEKGEQEANTHIARV